MSKIGKKPIVIPEGVDVTTDGREVLVKGPKGALSLAVPAGITVAVLGGSVSLSLKENSRRAPSAWGLFRSLLANAVSGVAQSFRKELELVGIGYRAEKKGESLVFSLGFSHPVVVSPPSGVTLEVVDKNRVAVSGCDKQLVGRVAAQIRSFKPPEPYKGKGLKYVGEIVRRKPGKAAKAGAALGKGAKT